MIPLNRRGRLALLAALFVGPAAFAQDETVPYPIDIERFRPHTDTYGYAITESSTTLQNLQVGVGFWGNYTDDPLVLIWNGDRVLGPGPKFPDGLVNQRTVTDFQAGIGIADVFSLTADVPVVVWQEGFEPTAEGSQNLTTDLQSAGLMDVRLSPKFVIADIHKGYPVGLAFLAPVSLPTGSHRSFIGEGTVTGTPTLAFEAADGSIHESKYHIRAAINAGVRLKSTDTFRDVPLGTEFVYRVAFAARPVMQFELGADLGGEVAGVRTAQAPTEILPWIRIHPYDWIAIGGGVGVGLVPGVGSPDLRGWGGATIAPRFDPLDLDRDGDGIPNKFDQCINIPEDKDGFEDEDGCPEDDNDKDGILDPQDACPNDPEDRDGFQDEDGCPEDDNDQDGILDPVDACPNVPEDRDGYHDEDGCPEDDDSKDTDRDGFTDNVDQCIYEPEDYDGFQDTDGCPEPDNDKDGLLDPVDACPNEPETVNGYMDQDGCPDVPSRVIVDKEKIRITEKVFFEVNKAIIKDISFDLLNEVARVMNEHPEITKIRVEGHTDSDGSDKYNLELSQRRSESVRDYLIGQGVDAARLVPVGYGESQPIDSNKTVEGKAQNRRVEFTILERDGVPLETEY